MNKEKVIAHMGEERNFFAGQEEKVSPVDQTNLSRVA
jgi:hypothetical protein